MSTKYRTFLDRSVAKSNPGNPYLDTYRYVLNDDGQEELVKCGKENIYEKIQAARFTADLRMILEKYQNHEIQSLDFVSGVYGDFISVPKTVHELKQRMLDADALFNTLPKELKEKFKFDPNVFFSSIGTDFYNETMAPYIERANLTLEKENKKPIPNPVADLSAVKLDSEVKAE